MFNDMGRPLLIIFLLTTLVISGCATTPKPAKVNLTIETSTDLNPDLRDRPSPIVLRIYNLRGIDAFKNARFFELYENAEQILGQELVSVKEIEISPNSVERREVEKMTGDTTHVGFLAAYRDIDRSIWREVISTPSGSKVNYTVRLNGLKIEVSPAKNSWGF